MNIKSVLFGSAAAMVMVSSASAADAIVAAEPEPMEYVRVCDAFGTGYFYIPGTETCLKIGGYVRFDVAAGDPYMDDHDADYENGWYTRSRAHISLATASDTEYGALKTSTVARWNFTPSTGEDTSYLIEANISLGGFLVGLADSQYSSYIGYAGDIINDDVISYGQFELNQITYLYDGGNGFTAVLSVQDDGKDGSDYGVDAVAGIGYSTGAFGFKVVGGYDESEDEGAIKARIDGSFGAVSAFLMAAWNTDGSSTNVFAPGDTYGSWGDWAVWGGIGAQLSEKLKANVQLAYTDNETFAAAANLVWEPVAGLAITPEVNYTNWDSIDEDQWAGMVRIQRSF